VSLVTFSDVYKFFGRQDILSGVTLSVEPQERIGLVGRNGSGKTTLIRLILGEEQPDKGRVVKAKGLTVGYLPQEILTRGGVTLLDMVLDTDPEYRRVESQLKEIEKKLENSGDGSLKDEEIMELAERQGKLFHDFERLGGWEKEASAKKILSGLGFLETDQGRDLREFSGGWIMRAVLARLLLAKPDLLILDEPTNHLDLDSLIYLEGYLKGISSALILVSHDRVFLNNISQKIIELRQGRADTYQGDYESYVEQKALRLATETQAFENQQERIKQLQQFIDKNRVRASTAKRAQSRIKVLDNLERLARPETDDHVKFKLQLPLGRRGPDMVLEMRNVQKSYGDLEVFGDLNLILRRGERLALVGPNGRGKSTLIKIAAGIIDCDGGSVRLGASVDYGYFSQFQMDSLNADLTVIEEFSLSAGTLTPGNQRSVLGSFLFSGDDVFKKVKVLSGGEKTRLVLAKIMMGAPNLLLLDEPTNHLDIAGRQMLEDALADYQGTMILISHDRHFINKLSERIGILENGGLTVYPGDYDDYHEIWLKKERKEEEIMEKGMAREASPPVEAVNKTERKADKKTEKKSGGKAGRKKDGEKMEMTKEKKYVLKQISLAEEAMERLAARQKELENLLSLPETYRDREKAKNLALEKKELKREEKELEVMYVTLLDNLERC
jgi:ATP-binding cassette subfamily F protein 3